MTLAEIKIAVSTRRTEQQDLERLLERVQWIHDNRNASVQAVVSVCERDKDLLDRCNAIWALGMAAFEAGCEKAIHETLTPSNRLDQDNF